MLRAVGRVIAVHRLDSVLSRSILQIDRDGLVLRNPGIAQREIFLINYRNCFSGAVPVSRIKQ